MHMSNQYELAIFAGGCFWCMVKPFDELPGIMKSYLAIQVEVKKIQLMKKYVLKQQVIMKLYKLRLIQNFSI